jgi:predicted small metal-binding protein
MNAEIRCAEIRCAEIRCDCGYVAEGADENELVASARVHGIEVHGMDFSAEQLLALARPATHGPGAGRTAEPMNHDRARAFPAPERSIP